MEVSREGIVAGGHAEDADAPIEDAIHVVNTLLEEEKKTLGEAMPRRSEK